MAYKEDMNFKTFVSMTLAVSVCIIRHSTTQNSV